MSSRPALAAIALAIAITGAVVVPSFGGPGWVAAVAVLVIVAIAAARSVSANVAGSFATLSLQVPHSLALLRLSVSDLFMLPAIVRSAFEMWSRREGLPASTLNRPFALVLVAFAVGAAIGADATGGLSSYVVVNRCAGIVFLMVGYLVLVRHLDSSARLAQGVRWFIFGVGIANGAALVGVAASLAGIDNAAFIGASLRANGWVGNPSLYGGILMTATALELGLLSAPATANDRRTWRWLNIILMGLSLTLTASRSTWLSLSIAAGSLLVALYVAGSRQPERRLGHRTMVLICAAAPALALGSILFVNLRSGMESVDERVAALQTTGARLRVAPPVVTPAPRPPPPPSTSKSQREPPRATQPSSPADAHAPAAAAPPAPRASQPSSPADAHAPAAVAPPGGSPPPPSAPPKDAPAANGSAPTVAPPPLPAPSPSPSRRLPVEPARPSREVAPPERTPADPVVVEQPPAPIEVPPAPVVERSLESRLSTAFQVSGSVMNARGLLDRTAIHSAAWSEYTRSLWTIVFGIGLGTFLSVSVSYFGIPLIIHNTFAWFLIELGPLGLIALLWVWGRTARNLWTASSIHDGRNALALGTVAAFAGMTAFWLINEGFYQRHFWLVLVLADRLATLPVWEPTAPPLAESPVPS